MEVKASLKYLRISPRKVRLVANLIKRLPVTKAESQLKYITKRSAKPILQLLSSAIANAEHNFHLEKDNLYIAGIRVDGGPVLKRWRARARGTAYPILKRSSHIFITLKEITPSSGKKRKQEEKAELKNREKKEEKVETKSEKKSVKTVNREVEKHIAPSFKKKTRSSSLRRPKIFQRKSF